MYTSNRFTGRTAVALALVGFLALRLPAAMAESGPAEVVELFNTAISDRDMDAAMALLADGGVQFQLRPAHPGMGDNPPLTADLRKTWQIVGAILFPATDAYSRRAEVTSVEADGDIATVWANTTTETHRKNHAEPMRLSFSEVYLLVRKGGQWKIAANADNRQPDDIAVAATP